MSDAEAIERLLESFEIGDENKVMAGLKDLPCLQREPGSYQAHPLLRAFVEGNDGHCYKDAHRRVADLLTDNEVLEFRDGILKDDVEKTQRSLEKIPDLVHAEFAGGRGIARGIHHWRSVRMGEVLIDAGSDLEVPTTRGETPLAMQLRFGALEGVRFLLKRGADVKAVTSPFIPSSRLESSVELLLAHGWAMGSAPLLHDAGHGHGERIRIWLKHGADPNVAGPDGRTAMHRLAEKGKGLVALEALIAAGGDLQAKDRDGKTAFDLAGESGRAPNEKFMKLLGSRS